MDQDRNLLFGVFAVQIKKITAIQLAEAAGAWASNPERVLGEYLVESGSLDVKGFDLIQRLVDEAISANDDDAEVTLAAFGGKEQVFHSFAGSILPTDSGGIETVQSPEEIRKG